MGIRQTTSERTGAVEQQQCPVCQVWFVALQRSSHCGARDFRVIWCALLPNSRNIWRGRLLRKRRALDHSAAR